jgi:acetylornithine/succinyldiaminopimelate/putrescine aminotransferase
MLQELRGLGLLLGFVLNVDQVPKIEGKTAAQVVVAELMQRGLLTVPAGPDVVRFLPPLTVSQEEITEALTILHDTFQSLTH